ncbi:ABC transporter permease [Spirochaeta africana]|uniref:Transport permease protein n=1 Tax=Spirochaeta africana (strain ATCC 700263 / DSM 8902 / Z-7692) TaxID=889378 RepID=H9UHU5_SPIAZ|nr:ABC transporter permease [Spirochaeta africana]AFG37088.1 ABC-type multidrug transport system, permease component [Spirochaeta africana DSM 8902]
MKIQRIRGLARKEQMHIFRDPKTLGILVLLPVVLLLLFGYAIDLDVTEVRFGVYDEDRSPESRRTLEIFEQSGYFRRSMTVAAADDGGALLDQEEIDLFIHIPRGYARALLRGEGARFGVQIDGANPQVGANVYGLIEAAVAAVSGTLGRELGNRALISAPSVPALRSRIWFNPQLESAQFLVPGLIAMILVITAVVSTAVGVSRERERGSMEQLRVSPLTPLEFILGKSAPYAFISTLIAVLIILLGISLFGVQISGSLFALTLVTVFFLVACLGLGLLISTVARTQQVAFVLAVLITFLPTFLLSGFVFPIRNMPLPIQNVSRIVPARYYLESLRRIMLKGGGITLVAEELLFLLGFACLTSAIALVRLRRIVNRETGGSNE